MTEHKTVALVSVLLVALVSSNAGAAFWDKKPKAEQHAQSSERAVSSSTGAYKAAMHQMHKDMHVPVSGNANIDFARQMVPHHQGALAMAAIQQKYGRDARLKRFNDWVILAQEQEVAMLQNWLRRRDNGAAPKAAMDYYGEAMRAMHHAMMIRYTGDADMDYARGMIAHHQGAVDMASILLTEGIDPELTELARSIYNSQTQEIAWLQRWLEARAAK